MHCLPHLLTCTGMPSRSMTASALALKTSGLRRPRLIPSWLVRITICQGGGKRRDKNTAVRAEDAGSGNGLEKCAWTKRCIPCTHHSEAASVCEEPQGIGFCKADRGLWPNLICLKYPCEEHLNYQGEQKQAKDNVSRPHKDKLSNRSSLTFQLTSFPYEW